MITITAVITAKSGREDVMRDALLAVAKFFAVAKPILDGEVVLVTATELSAKGG
jgi:hypothetical protein